MKDKIKVQCENKNVGKIMQYIVNKQIEDNPKMLDDILKLASEITIFNAKYGTYLDSEIINHINK